MVNEELFVLLGSVLILGLDSNLCYVLNCIRRALLWRIPRSVLRRKFRWYWRWVTRSMDLLR